MIAWTIEGLIELDPYILHLANDIGFDDIVDDMALDFTLDAMDNIGNLRKHISVYRSSDLYITT